MHWFYLGLAILAEVSGTTSMKMSEGFSKTLPTISTFVFYGLSMASLTMALKKIDVSVAYAIWSGMGILILTIIGVGWFKEALSLVKVGSILFIILGVVGLNLTGTAH